MKDKEGGRREEGGRDGEGARDQGRDCYSSTFVKDETPNNRM